jgi:hypothetical protein
MNHCTDCPFAPECEIHEETASDQAVVYYRGRYWADAEWSKVRKGDLAVRPAIVETEGTRRDIAVGLRGTGSSAKCLGATPEEVQDCVQQENQGPGRIQNRD